MRETDDGLSIRPSALHGGVFDTYADHRLATAAAVLGLAVPGVGVGSRSYMTSVSRIGASRRPTSSTPT